MALKLPVLSIELPREVRSVHQIEITSRCNLRCRYCTSPDIVAGKYPGRVSQDMPEDTFRRALGWAAHYVKAGSQTELNLAGIGESTLHPQFVQFVHEARAAVGPTCTLAMATNGVLATEEIAQAFKEARVQVCVSLHRPEKAHHAVELYRAAGVLVGISIDPSINANDWAGQVVYKSSPNNQIPCQWLREGKVFVFADGKISTCCLDSSGAGVVGHVNDEIGSVRSKPYGLCRTCYQRLDIRGYNQDG